MATLPIEVLVAAPQSAEGPSPAETRLAAVAGASFGDHLQRASQPAVRQAAERLSHGGQAPAAPTAAKTQRADGMPMPSAAAALDERGRTFLDPAVRLPDSNADAGVGQLFPVDVNRGDGPAMPANETAASRGAAQGTRVSGQAEPTELIPLEMDTPRPIVSPTVPMEGDRVSARFASIEPESTSGGNHSPPVPAGVPLGRKPRPAATTAFLSVAKDAQQLGPQFDARPPSPLGVAAAPKDVGSKAAAAPLGDASWRSGLRTPADDQVAQNQATQNQVAQNQATQNQVAQNEAAQNQVAPNRVTQNRVTQNQVAPNRVAANWVADQQVPQKQVAVKQDRKPAIESAPATVQAPAASYEAEQTETEVTKGTIGHATRPAVDAAPANAPQATRPLVAWVHEGNDAAAKPPAAAPAAGRSGQPVDAYTSQPRMGATRSAARAAGLQGPKRDLRDPPTSPALQPDPGVDGLPQEIRPDSPSGIGATASPHAIDLPVRAAGEQDESIARNPHRTDYRTPAGGPDSAEPTDQAVPAAAAHGVRPTEPNGASHDGERPVDPLAKRRRGVSQASAQRANGHGSLPDGARGDAGPSRVLVPHSPAYRAEQSVPGAAGQRSDDRQSQPTTQAPPAAPTGEADPALSNPSGNSAGDERFSPVQAKPRGSRWDMPVPTAEIERKPAADPREGIASDQGAARPVHPTAARRAAAAGTDSPIATGRVERSPQTVDTSLARRGEVSWSPLPSAPTDGQAPAQPNTPPVETLLLIPGAPAVDVAVDLKRLAEAPAADAEAVQPVQAIDAPSTVQRPEALPGGVNGEAPRTVDGSDRVRLVQRVLRAFQSVGGRDGRVRLRLSPKELGALQIEISVRDNAVTARLTAETSAARSLLLESLPDLRERLALQDLRIEHFEVEIMGQSGGGSPERDNRSDNSRQPAEHGSRDRRPALAPKAPRERATIAVASEGGQLNVVI